MRVTGGSARGTRLRSSRRRGLRPTPAVVREALFNRLAPEIEGAAFLDLFAGTGCVGIEALSRGARQAVFVEKARDLCRLVDENLRLARAEDRGAVIRHPVSTAIRTLRSRGALFDIIFLDPPYEAGIAPDVVKEVGEARLLAKEGVLVVEHAAREEMPCRAGELALTARRRYGDTLLSFYRWPTSAVETVEGDVVEREETGCSKPCTPGASIR